MVKVYRVRKAILRLSPAYQSRKTEVKAINVTKGQLIGGVVEPSRRIAGLEAGHRRVAGDIRKLRECMVFASEWKVSRGREANVCSLGRYEQGRLESWQGREA